MKIYFSGIPGRSTDAIPLGEEQSGGLLGRAQGGLDGGQPLAIPLPHLPVGTPDQRATVNWSRRHAQFDWDGRDWWMTMLGLKRTTFNGEVLSRGSRVRLLEDNVLECDQIRLRIARERTQQDPWATGVGGQEQDPWETGGRSPDLPPLRGVRVKAPVPTLVDAAPTTPLGEADLRILDWRRNAEEADEAAGRARGQAKTAVARRGTADAGRREAEAALEEVRKSGTPAQAREAARRASVAAAQARTAADQAEGAADSARAAAAHAEDRAKKAQSNANAAARAASAMPRGSDQRHRAEDNVQAAQEAATRAEAAAAQASDRAEEAAQARDAALSAAQVASEIARTAEEETAVRAAELARRVSRHAQLRLYWNVGGVLLLAVAIAVALGFAISS